MLPTLWPWSKISKRPIEGSHRKWPVLPFNSEDHGQISWLFHLTSYQKAQIKLHHGNNDNFRPQATSVIFLATSTRCRPNYRKQTGHEAGHWIRCLVVRRLSKFQYPPTRKLKTQKKQRHIVVQKYANWNLKKRIFCFKFEIKLAKNTFARQNRIKPNKQTNKQSVNQSNNQRRRNCQTNSNSWYCYCRLLPLPFFVLSGRFFLRLILWLIDWYCLFLWLTDWLIDRFTVWLID